MPEKSVSKEKEIPKLTHDPISTKKRWSNDVGMEYLEQIKKFIEGNLGNLTENQIIIDFNELSPPDKFENRTNNQRDLVSIEMPVYKFEKCIIKNVNFTYASINEWEFNSVTFENCTLDEASLKNSIFYLVTFKLGSTINGSNLRGAQLVNCCLTDGIMAKPIKYSPPWYPFMLIKLIAKFCNKEFSKNFHTYFSEIDTSKLSATANKEIKAHITWYEHLLTQIDTSQERNLANKLSLFLAILTTNYWNSYRVLIWWAFLFNFMMAYQILNLPEGSFDFGAIEKNLGSCFYYCVVTFTTLGYGDVHPCTGTAQFCAGITAVMGYVTLGILIYLITRKVDSKF